MNEYNQKLLESIRVKCLDLPFEHQVRRSYFVSFRDVFDPYCNEYKSIDDEDRVMILRYLLEFGLTTSILPFYELFVDMFIERRPDIASAAADGMVFLLDYVIPKADLQG